MISDDLCVIESLMFTKPVLLEYKLLGLLVSRFDPERSVVRADAYPA